MDDTQACPYCGETIKRAAVVCRFCNRDLKTGQVPAPAKKRPSIWAYLAVTLAMIGGCYWFFGLGRALPRTRTAPARAVSTDPVVYEVTGSARTVSLTYQTPGGSVQKDVPLPWTERQSLGTGDFLYLSAQNNGESGSVTCTIRAGGGVFVTNTSTGAYKIATCSGSAP